MNPDDLRKFLTENIEPLEDSIYGHRYRAAAYLTDGTYLPCVVFQSKKAQLELALRRFKQLRWNRSQYRGVVEVFVAGGSRVAEHHLKSVEISPYAWPPELLRTVHGETTMGWTAFVAEMKDGTMHSYGTQFNFEFFELPEAYSFSDIGKIHSGMVYSQARGLHAFSAQSQAETVHSYGHSLRERPFFACYLKEL